MSSPVKTGDPVFQSVRNLHDGGDYWIPAFAGMTAIWREPPQVCRKRRDHEGSAGWARRMIAKWLLQTLIWIVAIGALLFVPAGTLRWPAAWVFLATFTAIGLLGGWWLARTDPALLAERMRPPMQAEQPAADRKFVVVFGLTALIWLVAIGLDERWRASEIPIALQELGFAMLVGSSIFIMWVMHENSFASAVVRVQTERGHRVVGSGPYAWVRHPMYSGTILFLVGMSLLLGSWWGVAISLLFPVLFSLRVRIEERALIAGLPDYADYAARVRYRLAPGLW
jgi:protein-S-isoprenylcysteine O-methyltransferase Ste14